MRLVTLDVIREVWRYYTIDSCEVWWPEFEKWDQNLYKIRERVPRAWRYQYWSNNKLVQGIAAIDHDDALGRARIRRLVRRGWRDEESVV